MQLCNPFLVPSFGRHQHQQQSCLLKPELQNLLSTISSSQLLSITVSFNFKGHLAWCTLWCNSEGPRHAIPETSSATFLNLKNYRCLVGLRAKGKTAKVRFLVQGQQMFTYCYICMKNKFKFEISSQRRVIGRLTRQIKTKK